MYVDEESRKQFNDNILQKPEVFFQPSEPIAKDIASFTKSLFDLGSSFEPSPFGPLTELYVDGYDADQIWEQIKLKNVPLMKHMTKSINRFLDNAEDISLLDLSDSDSSDIESEQHHEQSSGEELDQDSDDNSVEIKSDDEEKKSQPKKKSKKKRDVGEDGFFDWDEMEKAAEQNEISEDEKSDDELGGEEEDDDNAEFDELDENSLLEKDAKEMHYQDFFDSEEDEHTKNSGSESESETEEQREDGTSGQDVDTNVSGNDAKIDTNNKKSILEIDEDTAERGILSSFGERSLRLNKQVKELENELIADKPWQLKGEVKSGLRPENSLLEATLDYDRPTRVAPTITPEVTAALEDIIKERVREDNYDDVIRILAPTEKANIEQQEVSMEKSKEGLGEIYEKEYMKNAMGLEEDEASKKDQDNLQVMFDRLCWKLDALSNFHFTPKPHVKEMVVQQSLPAISMEEAVPMAVSDANLKAPEEIYQKKRGRESVLQSESEMSQQQRKAKRQANKTTRRKAKRHKEAEERLVAKINPGLGNKYEKKKMLESIQDAKNVTKGKISATSEKGHFTSSSKFFSNLQDDVNQSIGKVSHSKQTSGKDDTKSVAQFKL